MNPYVALFMVICAVLWILLFITKYRRNKDGKSDFFSDLVITFVTTLVMAVMCIFSAVTIKEAVPTVIRYFIYKQMDDNVKQIRDLRRLT